MKDVLKDAEETLGLFIEGEATTSKTISACFSFQQLNFPRRIKEIAKRIRLTCKDPTRKHGSV